MKGLWLLLAIAIGVPPVISSGQVRNVGKDIVDAYRDGVALRLQRERVEMERQSQEDLRLLMRKEAERLEAETERIKAETRRIEETQKSAPGPPSATEISNQISAALISLRVVYPDLESHLTRMSRLTASFRFGDSSAVSLRDYLEGLYVISKFASFARSEKPPSAEGETKP